MQGHVCAWCQCDLHVAPGDVEHFRPKSLYWWLAYDFNNYLLSCPTCNTRKGWAFPLLNAWRCTWPERRRLHEERHDLLDPIVDDVEKWLRVRRQNRLYRLVPAAGLGMNTVERRRAEATLALFKWNENPRLVIARKEAVKTALRAAERAVQGDRGKRVEVKRLASRFQPFGVAIRQLLEEKHPGLLPTPEEELFFFVRHLTKQHSEAQKMLLEKPGNELAQRYAAETLWALAVLWKDPPHVSPGEIDRWLVKLGCRDQVWTVLAQL